MTRLWKPELNKYFSLLFCSALRLKRVDIFSSEAWGGSLWDHHYPFNVWSWDMSLWTDFAIGIQDNKTKGHCLFLLDGLAVTCFGYFSEKKPDMIMLELDFTTTTRKKPQPPNKMGLYHKWEKKHFPLGSFNKVLCGVKQRLEVIFTGLGTP